MRLSEKAYHLIKKNITTLEMSPLSVVDEQSLQEELGLGRTPIREALHRLSAEGLIIVAPRRGMFVADISITDLAKIFEVRMAMEGFCAQLAARRITEKQVAEMEKTLDLLNSITDANPETLMAIDEQFHSLLYQASDNAFLMDSLERLHSLSMRLWHMVVDRLGDLRETMEQHRAIMDALRAGDGDKAEDRIRQHINEFQVKIRAALDNF